MRRFTFLLGLLQALPVLNALAHFMDCPVLLEGPQLWRQVFLCGTELEQVEEVYGIKWDFSHLDEALQEDGFLSSSLHSDPRNMVYLFGSTEPQMVQTIGENTTVVPIPVIVAVKTRVPLPEQLALNSVQMEKEQVVDMSQYKMAWLPITVPPLSARQKRLRLRGAEEEEEEEEEQAGAKRKAVGGAGGEHAGKPKVIGGGVSKEGGGVQGAAARKAGKRRTVDGKVWGLGCSQRKARGVLKNLKEERTRMFDYCMPYIFLPHKQQASSAEQEDTVVDIICNLPDMQAPLVFDFDWEMDDAEDMAKEKVEEEELDAAKYETLIANAIREEVAKAKAEAKVKAAEKEQQAQAISASDAEALRALTTIKFYPRNDKCGDVKSKYINRYYGQADQVL